MSKWAIFSLFFCFFIVTGTLSNQALASFIEPSAAPPEDNTPLYLNIGDLNQAKRGALRLGTDDITSPFNYQLEVLGDGARISQLIVDNNLKVNNTTDTLFVDAIKDRVCVGPCIDIAGSKLEISGGGMAIDGSTYTGLWAVSSDSQAVYGVGDTYGVQGVASSSNQAGIWAFSALGTAVEGVNTSNNYSAVAGFSTNGYGVYGINTNSLSLWAGYFQGRLESNDDVSGAKFLARQLQHSLIPFTAGQVVETYNLGNISVKSFDGTHLWAVDSNKLYKIRAADGFKIFETAVGTDPTDVFFDGNYIWVTVGGNNKVIKLDPYDGTGTPLCTLANISNPQSIAFDNTYYWVTASDSRELIKMDKDCTQVGSVPGLPSAAASLGKVIYNGSYLWVLGTELPGGDDVIFNINPSDVNSTAGYKHNDFNNLQDIFFDNYYYWVVSADSNTITRFYFDISKSPPVVIYGTYSTGTGPSNIVFDGTYIWVANATSQNLTRFLAADPTQTTSFPLVSGITGSIIPNGFLFDGTYLWVSSNMGLIKLYSGTGYGSTNLQDILTLQFNSPLIQQNGSINISGSGRLGGNMTAGGELSADNNMWAAQQTDDVFYQYGDTWVNTGNLAAISGVNHIHSLIETSDGTTLYLGTEKGDIYKSVDNGVNWSATGELSSATDVYSMLEANDGTLYAGTSPNGDVFKSTDGGTNWINTGNLTDGGTDVVVVYSLIQASTGTIFAGTYPNARVFTYNTGTDTWTKTAGDPAGGFAAYSLLEASDGTFYLGTGVWGAADVFKSVDGGQNWISTRKVPLTSANYTLSLLESSDVNNTIYAATGPFGHIFKTTDQGNTWIQAVKFGANDVNTIIEAGDGALYAGTSWPGQGVYKSTDGNNWNITSELVGVMDVNILIESNSGALYAGTANNSGVYKSTNGGDDWTNVNHLGGLGDLVDARFIYSLLQASDGTFYAGTGYGDVFKSVNEGISWANTGHLLGVTFLNDLLQASDGAIYAGTNPNGDVYKSTDGGINWINTGNLAGAIGVYSLIESSDGTTLYAGASSGKVFKSTNRGITWEEIVDFGGNGVTSIIEASDGTLYAGTYGGGVYKSINKGGSWTDITGELGTSRIYCLLETSNGAIYAGIYEKEYLYKSTNKGESWSPTSDLPGANTATHTNALVEGSNGAIYAATGGGSANANVYESTDGGDSWIALGNPTLYTALGVDTYFVYSLIEASDLALYAGTRPNGDVAKLELGALDGGIYACPNGHFMKNIEVDDGEEVTKIECRAL